MGRMPRDKELDARHEENCARITDLLLEGRGAKLLNESAPGCRICGKRHHALGLCRLHYERQYAERRSA